MEVNGVQQKKETHGEIRSYGTIVILMHKRKNKKKKQKKISGVL